MMKCVFLFLCTNLLIILFFGSILSIMGCNSDYLFKLVVISSVLGMGGAVISLYLSKYIALSAVNGKVINRPSNDTEDWLLQVIHNQSFILKFANPPKLAVYDSSNMNAFATGFKKNDSLIAVSTGLLYRMSKESIEAVIAHEMSHIISGDMVTMTLMQGIINSFVVFIAYYFTQLIICCKSVVADDLDDKTQDDCSNNDDNNKYYSNNIENSLMYTMISSILELIFGTIASIIVFWFSRAREFYADSRAAKLVGNSKMIVALQELQCDSNIDIKQSNSIRTLYINNINCTTGLSNIINNLFSSHPSLSERIEALKSNIYV